MSRVDEMHDVVATGNMEQLKTFLESEPELVQQKDRDGCTALVTAARDGRLAAVQLLVENGADIESRDPVYSRTPLAWATFQGHKDVVSFLVQCGADVNAIDAYSNSPLKTAAMGGQGAWREWVSVRPHDYEAIAAVLRQHGASEKHDT